MRPDLERLHYIERHLLGQPATTPAWHLQVLLDPDLAVDAAAQQQLYHGLHQAGQQQLRRELKAIHQRLYGRDNWWQRAGTALRIALVRLRFGYFR